MAMDDQWVIDFNQHQKQLWQLVAKINSDPYLNEKDFFLQASMAADELPHIVRQKLYNFHLTGNNEGILLLRNLPISKKFTDNKNLSQHIGTRDKISEKCLAMIGSRLGLIIGYIQEKDGALFQNIVPIKGKEYEQSSSSSLAYLDFHTEKHFHPQKPDYVLLYCLRGNKTAKTYYVNIHQVLDQINCEQKVLLFQRLFRSGIDYIFGNPAKEKGNGPLVSILYGHPQSPFICYDSDLMVGITSEAEQVLETLRSIIKFDDHNAIVLMPGDLLVLDNRRVVHGRGMFNARYNESDRWLQRVYIKIDIESSATTKCQQGNRVIHTEFSSL